VIGPLGLGLKGRWLGLGERSLGKSGRRQRAGVCGQHKRAAGDNQRPTEGFEEGRHHAGLSYLNLLQIENRLVHFREKNRPRCPERAFPCIRMNATVRTATRDRRRPLER
jgi:hypothetical protein